MRKWFTFESQVIYDGTEGLHVVFRRRSVSRRSCRRVVSIVSKLEAAGNGVSNGGLP